jgi:hypothetical protein
MTLTGSLAFFSLPDYANCQMASGHKPTSPSSSRRRMDEGTGPAGIEPATT